ncbi:hypothetical protein BC826DRAFT_1112184 [Russula brevipes]|nr:hypothetical protein BC826DRAFT_1112184 [Russula brevipes]
MRPLPASEFVEARQTPGQGQHSHIAHRRTFPIARSLYPVACHPSFPTPSLATARCATTPACPPMPRTLSLETEWGVCGTLPPTPPVVHRNTLRIVACSLLPYYLSPIACCSPPPLACNRELCDNARVHAHTPHALARK